MKKIISNEEYDICVMDSLDINKMNFLMMNLIMCFVAILVVDLISHNISDDFTLIGFCSIVFRTLLWSTIFTLLHVPIRKNSLKKIYKRQIKDELVKSLEKEYDLYLPCIYIKSKFHLMGGVLYFSTNKLLFKPHVSNFAPREIKLESKNGITFYEKKQNTSAITRFIYNSIPNYLVINVDGEENKFIVPMISKVMDVLEEEGLQGYDF
ncbi:hypothetical protein [Helicovermis profundi]|uniref:GRAM domain-containing protein n=1 Tax=Helicovermis profundi TaxID=3065157 RepID=A0AAU9EG51_9FIRM|nr:hypothetical protein HLPR_07290 [Clostridia bacterium S502]